MTARTLARYLVSGLAGACSGCALVQDFDYRSESAMLQAEHLEACSEVGYGVPCQSGAKSCTKAGGACSSETGNNAACCATIRLEGGMFSRGFDHGGAKEDGKTVLGWVAEGEAPAAVPAFALDRFEVSVGRFRHFVGEYDAFIANLPQLGRGAIPEAPGTGWSLGFGAPLPESEVALRERLKARNPSAVLAPGAPPAKTLCTWKDAAGASEDVPITCVDWFMALSFCIWDGGRLPSEAEWNFAAAVGSEQRAFPASVSGPFDAKFGVVATQLIAQVGSKPQGASPYGHHDLSGNVWEWVYDSCKPGMGETACDEFVYPTSCEVCVAVDGPNRWMRGGSFNFFPADARSSARVGLQADARFDDLGFRCARDL